MFNKNKVVGAVDKKKGGSVVDVMANNYFMQGTVLVWFLSAFCFYYLVSLVIVPFSILSFGLHFLLIGAVLLRANALKNELKYMTDKAESEEGMMTTDEFLADYSGRGVAAKVQRECQESVSESVSVSVSESDDVKEDVVMVKEIVQGQKASLIVKNGNVSVTSREEPEEEPEAVVDELPQLPELPILKDAIIADEIPKLPVLHEMEEIVKGLDSERAKKIDAEEVEAPAQPVSSIEQVDAHTVEDSTSESSQLELEKDGEPVKCLECEKVFYKGDTVAVDQHGNEGCDVCSKVNADGSSVFVMLQPLEEETPQ